METFRGFAEESEGRMTVGLCKSILQFILCFTGVSREKTICHVHKESKRKKGIAAMCCG